jgi:hypothetical protein
MSHSLNDAVPWGRGLGEYERMFALTASDLSAPILGCADGPASFNAEASARGARVVTCDPLYRYSASGIAARIDATHPAMVAHLERRYEDYVWREFDSPARVVEARLTAMDRFLRDYANSGRGANRYVAGAVPHLPLQDRAFPLALCSHFLFLNAPALSLAFHIAALVDLCRVAREVRVFPLLDMSGTPSALLDPVQEYLRAAGHFTECVRVAYEFQRGGNTMFSHPLAVITRGDLPFRSTEAMTGAHPLTQGVS